MKYRLTLLIICTSFLLEAQIKTTSYIDVGVTNWSKIIYFNDFDYKRVKSDELSYYSTIALKVSFNRFSITNKLTTYINKSINCWYTFTPILTDYNIRAEFKYKYGIIGIEHECTHPVVTSPYQDSKNVFRSSHDRLFIRFKF